MNIHRAHTQQIFGWSRQRAGHEPFLIETSEFPHVSYGCCAVFGVFQQQQRCVWGALHDTGPRHEEMGLNLLVAVEVCQEHVVFAGNSELGTRGSRVRNDGWKRLGVVVDLVRVGEIKQFFSMMVLSDVGGGHNALCYEIIRVSAWSSVTFFICVKGSWRTAATAKICNAW